MAALDDNFSLHWSCDSDTQGHEKSQLSSTAATTSASHSFAQRMRFYPAQYLMHKMPSRVLLTIEWGPTCSISTPHGSQRRLVPEWAKEPALLLLRRQPCPSKCAVTDTAPNTGWGRAQLAHLRKVNWKSLVFAREAQENKLENRGQEKLRDDKF